VEYPSIDNLWASRGEGKEFSRQPEHGLSRPELGLVTEWIVTEKVDGMNTRVLLVDGAYTEVEVRGRTDKAQVPPTLQQAIWDMLPRDAVWRCFAEGVGVRTCPDVTLYGEGYGAGIQKGGVYRPDQSFILFDVLVDNRWWLRWDDVRDVARKLGIPHVPELARGVTSVEAIAPLVGYSALTGTGEGGEGVVCRPEWNLFDNRGHRLMFKLKVRDLR
jgi:ATP-dependent RNA circularization protein (DNA/RNA ligase family)